MTTLHSAVAALNRIKQHAALASTLLRGLRALVLGAVTVSIWALVSPTDQLAQLALGCTVFVVACLASLRRGEHRTIDAKDLALALEIRHGDRTASPLGAAALDQPLPGEWEPLVAAEVRELRAFENRRLVALASTLVLPLAVSFLTLPHAAPSFKLAFSEVSNVVARLGRGASLRVVQGAVNDKTDKPLPLDGASPLELELLAQNLVEVNITGGGFGKTAPIVELRRKSQTDAKTAGGETGIFQSFQTTPIRDGKEAATGDASRHSISFAVSEDVDLFVPAIDQSRALAHIKVRQLPIPKVTLTAPSDREDPWPDDQPLNLHIQVKAENPLQTVRLLIKSGQRVSKELVANVMAEDKLELSTDYRLILETYVENDLAQVEIVAEAVDRSVPTPLAGYSEPLKLNTASAYGRYRQALQTLRELKTQIDDGVTKGAKTLPKEAKDLAHKAADQSEKSPFFDGLDRVQIHRFDTRVDEIQQAPETNKLMDLSQTLNDFLFEHEILDDRERDRDFFVATRALSRLVEQDAGKRPVALKTVTARMKKFLDDRHDRWTKRVERLTAGYKPEGWPQIRDKKPFHQMMDQVEKLDEKSPQSPAVRSEQLTLLSKSVVDYRAWIEDLEAKEDKMREAEERQRQEGLASARDTLRELQKRQGEVSADLDRSAERPAEELQGLWPATRMKQNANSKETRRLESQMRSLSPTANARILAAIQSMELTSESGNAANFQTAESGSDMAGRLLRQAESAAQQSQQKRRSRGRRRRVTGDNYYGQSVVGGDVEIKREYQVDRRYREDILDEVQSTALDDENRTLLDTYLRHVVR